MEFIIAWIMFGVAAAVMAKGKNRNVVLWVIIGLLIGPFALLIIGLMKALPAVDEGEEAGRRD
jgi:hypothetical protein